jgi:hypothetical protein
MHCSNGRNPTVVMGKCPMATIPSLLCHSSNGLVDINEAHCYNIFSLNTEMQLHLTSPGLTTDHHGLHESSTWGPHKHARHLYHRLRSTQSTYTISSSHRTTEHCRQRTHRLPNHPRVTTYPTTLASVACTRVPPTQTTSVTTRAHARMRPSVYVQHSSVRFSF